MDRKLTRPTQRINTHRANGSSSESRQVAPPGKRKGPRSRVLPGLEQVRVGKLDNLCEALGEARARMNEAKVEETSLLLATLQVMVAKGVSVYKHAGVELARIPGSERLRVRLTKEQGDADASDLESPEPTTADNLDGIDPSDGNEDADEGESSDLAGSNATEG